jgi:phosphatidylinositol alpha-1,6-mannosyltransferase
MKILMCSNSFPPAKGGSQRYSLEVATHLTAFGEDVVFLTRKQPGAQEFDRALPFRVIRRRSKIAQILTFLRLAAVWRPEVIFVTHRADFAALASFANKIFGIPYVISAYGGEILHAFRARSVRKNFARARKIIAISNFTKSLLVNLSVEEEKIVIVPCGTDPEKFRPNLDPQPIIRKYGLAGKRVILSVSRLVERKGHANVIAALLEVLKKVPETVYLIVGTGDQEDNLKKQVAELGLREHVILAGSVPDEEIPLCYAACDIFVMPSFPAQEGENVEGFGIAFLEANSCGKPVVGGKSGGVEDAIADGKTGILVNSHNVGEISNAIVRLLCDRDLAQRLGSAGRERVVSEYNWKEVSRKILDVLRTAAQGERRETADKHR